MSYIYNTFKPYLCTDVIRIIEDMVRWELDANWNYIEHNGKYKWVYGHSSIKFENRHDWFNDVKFDKNFVGEKVLSVTLRENLSYPMEILIAHRLKVINFSNPIQVIKINETIYALIKCSISKCIYIANDLQTLYENYLNDREKKDYFELDMLWDE